MIKVTSGLNNLEKFHKKINRSDNSRNMWSEMESGFTSHKISKNKLTTEFMNNDNKILYSFDIHQ